MRPVDERTEPRRPLLWWHMPERPGVGDAILFQTAVWFVALLLLLVVVAVTA